MCSASRGADAVVCEPPADGADGADEEDGYEYEYEYDDDDDEGDAEMASDSGSDGGSRGGSDSDDDAPRAPVWKCGACAAEFPNTLELRKTFGSSVFVCVPW